MSNENEPQQPTGKQDDLRTTVTGADGSRTTVAIQLKTTQLSDEETVAAVKPADPSSGKYGEAMQGIINQFIIDKMAPHEKMWRAFCRPSSTPLFVSAAVAPTREMVRNVLGVVAAGKWPTLSECIPPGSVLELIDSAFYKRTDIPRELPFFTVLHYLSALLLQQGVEIDVNGKRTLPDFWTIALAPSGAGKTFTQSTIADALGGVVKLFPESASAAMFVETLASNNRGLWLRDEFAQYLNMVNTQTHMAQVKDFLLRAYDYTTIEHRIKKESFVIEKPALTIFGTTPLATIKNYLTAESLVDGFAQRFAFVVAEKDERPPVSFYDLSAEMPGIQAAWLASAGAAFHKVYRVDSVGLAAYDEAFKLILQRSGSVGIEESFSRRIMWRSMKYAVLYHILLGKTDDVLHAEDMTYAARLAALNLRDLRRLLDQYEVSQFADLSGKAASWIRRAHGEKGKKINRSALIAGVRGVGNSRNAQDLLEYLADSDAELAKMIDLGKPPKAAPPKSGFTGKSVLGGGPTP